MGVDPRSCRSVYKKRQFRFLERSIHMIAAKTTSLHGFGLLVERLNSKWHRRALRLYMFVVLAHWMEHIFQAYQYYVLGMSRQHALGAMGMVWPVLVSSEVLHFGYALFMLVGLLLIWPGFTGRSRSWWNFSIGVQTWHFLEHLLLQIQIIVHQNFFGGTAPTSLLQIWFPRLELHLFYNSAVFVPMVIAIYYHMYPPKEERYKSFACTCSKVHQIPYLGNERA